MFHIFGNFAINRFRWKIQQFSEGHGALGILLSFLEFVHSELFWIVQDNPICPRANQKWFMVRAVHFLLKHQLHNASRDRAKNPSESPDLAFYRDNGETYLPNYAIIQNIVEAWLRNNVILIFFNIVCFATWIVDILLLRVHDVDERRKNVYMKMIKILFNRFL